MPATVIPFTLADRWIVTIESERHLVNVRHRTRWYSVARRKGHKDRRHWWASRDDATYGAQLMRDWIADEEWRDWIMAQYNRMNETQRAKFLEQVRRIKAGDLHNQPKLRLVLVQNPCAALGDQPHTTA